MPYLGDYIGKIISEIANARFQADLESVRLAELYLSHPLLRQMPVPRFRIPTLTLEVPVAIKEMKGQNNAADGISFKTLRRIHQRFNSLLETQLQRMEIVLSKQDREKLHSELTQELFTLKQPLSLPLSITHIADEFAGTVLAVLKRLAPGRESELKNLADSLKEMIHVTFADLLRIPARLEVLAATAELREAGPADILTRLNFSITEEGVQWTILESGEKFNTRLVRE